MYTRTVKGAIEFTQIWEYFYYKYTSMPPFSPWGTSYPPYPLQIVEFKTTRCYATDIRLGNTAINCSHIISHRLLSYKSTIHVWAPQYKYVQEAWIWISAHVLFYSKKNVCCSFDRMLGSTWTMPWTTFIITTTASNVTDYASVANLLLTEKC